MSGTGLSDAEQSLWDAFPAGRQVDLRHHVVGDPPVPGADIRAEVLARLLLGEVEARPGRVPALRLRGATITGALDLSGCDLQYSLVAQDCTFDQQPLLEASSTALIDLSGSAFPGLLLRDARVDGLLRLTGCRSSQAVRLTRAHVTKTADLTGLRVSGAPALLGDSLVVERDLLCRDAVIDGEVLLWSAHVGGTLVLEGAGITHPAGATLNGDGLVVDGGLFGGVSPQVPGSPLVSEGELRLQDAKISRCCTLTGARLRNAYGSAFNAERLHVEGPLALDTGFTAEGPVVLTGASVQGPLLLQGATLNGAGERALDASLARISGDVAAGSGFTATGQLMLEETHVDGSVVLSGARLHHPHGETLSARRLHVLGRIGAEGLVSTGQIVLNDARVGASVELPNARLTNPPGHTLTAWGLSVGGTLDCCDGFLSNGQISLTNSRIHSDLCLEGTTVDGPLTLNRITAGSLRTDDSTRLRGLVDLRHARIGVLADLPAHWPDVLSLDGLLYDHLKVTDPVSERLAWLAREQAGYLPQPYEQLAAAYARQGLDDAARQVLLAKCRRRQSVQPTARRWWGLLQDWTVGYGYRPMRAAVWLLFLLVAGACAFAAHHPPAVKPAEAPPFNPLLYTLDLLLPVVGFGQQQAFNPLGWQQWLAAAVIAAGWILATTVAAGLTRTLARR
ncbi:hypothetical protein [Streptomyces sp. NPDC093568]|uniref:hypothetical protein n=1 Tax=Streptomyces sp. NPDC093568 TaxID=3366041 RepID=UPI00382DFBBC